MASSEHWTPRFAVSKMEQETYRWQGLADAFEVAGYPGIADVIRECADRLTDAAGEYERNLHIG